jgi:aspartate/methionine/tyrosine aminotransferase
MPRPPHSSPGVAAIKGSVYSALLHKLTTHKGEVYPLHVGDTWKLPPEGCRVGNLRSAELKGLSQYTEPQGLRALVDAVVERVRATTGVPVERRGVVVTGGATAGLAAAVGAIVSAGDEVLLLAPHWPLIDGIVRMFGGRPIPVPFLGAVDSAEVAAAAVRSRATPKTVALYVNTPNNPTGRVIPKLWLEALVEWARKQNVWLLFDEVYEDYQYEGMHTSGLSLAPERSIAAHSFSKAYGMAGNRCGYLVGPPALMPEILKLHTHTTYSAPTASQIVALRVLQGAGAEWLKETREEYRETGKRAAAMVGVPAPEGSTFLFLDVSKRLGDGGLMRFLESCGEEGLFAAPWPSFGPYPTHVRVCYTAARPDVVMRGMAILARKLGLL